jgi:hypothetical protein
MKKQGGGLLENKIVLYVVSFIALFNVLASVSIQDWNSILVFMLVGFICYKLKIGNTLSVIVAIIGLNVVRMNKIMKEGLETENKKESELKTETETETETEPKKNKKEPVPNEKKIENVSELKEVKEESMTLEGLTKKAEGLMDRQEQLHKLAEQLGPMMKQAQGMMNSLPKNMFKK